MGKRVSPSNVFSPPSFQPSPTPLPMIPFSCSFHPPLVLSSFILRVLSYQPLVFHLIRSSLSYPSKQPTSLHPEQCSATATSYQRHEGKVWQGLRVFRIVACSRLFSACMYTRVTIVTRLSNANEFCFFSVVAGRGAQKRDKQQMRGWKKEKESCETSQMLFTNWTIEVRWCFWWQPCFMPEWRVRNWRSCGSNTLGFSAATPRLRNNRLFEILQFILYSLFLFRFYAVGTIVVSENNITIYRKKKYIDIYIISNRTNEGRLSFAIFTTGRKLKARLKGKNSPDECSCDIMIYIIQP